MRQFINASESDIQRLKESAEWSCIRFRNQEMPPNCSPSHADLGFEINPDSGMAKLLVNHGVRYPGQNPQIQQWFIDGKIEFESFSELINWIRGPISESFSETSENDSEVQNPVIPKQKSLTDLQAVNEQIVTIEKPLYLDEDKLFNELSKSIRGQDNALQALSSVIVRHCARKQPTRPAVVFAIGPSGVGKTRTAESLATILHSVDSENTGYGFLRLDMTEYQEEHRVSQLIGAPQGYAGYSDGSQLIDSLRSNPRMIILFDEIEKAHPAILRILMNAMDAGRLSTSTRSDHGHEIDCRYAVFMFTSNLNSKEILSELENNNAFGNRAMEDEICRRRLHATGIAPEIIGRIGRFLVYNPLSMKVKAEIMSLMVAEVAKEYGVDVSYVEPSIIVDLLKQTKSQNFGVRPGRYLIDEILGSAFIKAAEQQIPNPVKITGSPFRCEPDSK